MARQVTIARSNRYCQARLRAAKFNEQLSTRVGVAEVLPGVTEESLKKYELDITRPPNTVVALMADAYNDPDLRLWYCANECPLGRDCREADEMPAERTLIRLQNIKGTIESVASSLSIIMDDGVLDSDETAMLPKLREELLEAKRRTEEALALLEKAGRSGRFE